jgi:DTW domain-containing protein YfiP
LVIHQRELKRTTNTGRLATAALTNHDFWVRGDLENPLEISRIFKAGYRPLLFYPAVDAHELTPELVAASPVPIQLIVPDGNWRQAGKLHYRYRELDAVPRVKIGMPNQAREHLRAEREGTPEGLSTLEAIARAFAILEGAQVGDALLNLYLEKLRRTLDGRGRHSPS